MYDVTVLGLGAAGVMACKILDNFDLRILALEAGSGVGGRICTKEFGKSIVELGAEWIHGTTNNTAYAYAELRNFDIKAQSPVHIFFSSNGELEDSKTLQDLWEYTFRFVNNPPSEARPLGQYLTEKIQQYESANLPELEEDRAAYFSKFLRWMNLIIGNHESCDDWNNVSTQSQYQELEGSQYMSWHKRGYKNLLDILFNIVHMAHVSAVFNTEVVQIKMPDKPSGPIKVTCRDGTIYYTQVVIVTVSLGVLKERHETLFVPRLPEEKVKAIEHLSIGVVNKVVLLFEKPWWPTNVSCLAFLWRPEDLAEVPESDMWVTKTCGASITLANDDSLVFWLSGKEAKLVETLSDDEVKTKLMWVLRKFVGKLYVVVDPIDMIRSSWLENPFTRGSYSYDNVNMPDLPYARLTLSEPVTDDSSMRIFFAGEATDPNHFSTVHGALDSGSREAIRYIDYECPRGRRLQTD